LSQFFVIHPETPQKRLIDHACEIIRQGGVVVYPTDTSYAIGCHIGDKRAVDRIRQIRRLDDKHLFTLMCRDLSDLGVYARVNNQVFRQLKAHTPGPFTLYWKPPRKFHAGFSWVSVNKLACACQITEFFFLYWRHWMSLCSIRL